MAGSDSYSWTGPYESGWRKSTLTSESVSCCRKIQLGRLYYVQPNWLLIGAGPCKKLLPCGRQYSFCCLALHSSRVWQRQNFSTSPKGCWHNCQSLIIFYRWSSHSSTDNTPHPACTPNYRGFLSLPGKFESITILHRNPWYSLSHKGPWGPTSELRHFFW